MADELLVQKEPCADVQSWQHYCVITAAEVNTMTYFKTCVERESLNGRSKRMLKVHLH